MRKGAFVFAITALVVELSPGRCIAQVGVDIDTKQKQQKQQQLQQLLVQQLLVQQLLASDDRGVGPDQLANRNSNNNSDNSKGNPGSAALPAEQKSTNITPKRGQIQSKIENVLQTQADAWNRGDLDSFLRAYVHSPDVSFISGESQIYGYDELLQRYDKKYGASHDTMGTLTFSHLNVQSLGKSHALCIGEWHLERKQLPPVGGIFTLVFIHAKDGWQIMHDHTSTWTASSETQKP